MSLAQQFLGARAEHKRNKPRNRGKQTVTPTANQPLDVPSSDPLYGVAPPRSRALSPPPLNEYLTDGIDYPAARFGRDPPPIAPGADRLVGLAMRARGSPSLSLEEAQSEDWIPGDGWMPHGLGAGEIEPLLSPARSAPLDAGYDPAPFDVDADFRAHTAMGRNADQSWRPEQWRGMEGARAPGYSVGGDDYALPYAAWETAIGREPVPEFSPENAADIERRWNEREAIGAAMASRSARQLRDRTTPFGVITAPFVNTMVEPERRRAFVDWLDEPLLPEDWFTEEAWDRAGQSVQDAVAGAPDAIAGLPAATERVARETPSTMLRLGDALGEGYDWVSRQADPDVFSEPDFVGGVGTLARDYGPDILRALTYGPWENEAELQAQLELARELERRGLGDADAVNALARSANAEAGWAGVNAAFAPLDVPALAQFGREVIGMTPRASARLGAEASRTIPESAPRSYEGAPSPQGDVIDVPFEVVEPRPQRRFEAAVQDPETGRVYAGLDHGEAIDAIPDDAVRARLQAMYDADPSFGGFNVDGRYMAREEGLASLRAERPQSVRIGEQVNRDGSVSPSDPIDWDADIAPERASWRDLGLGAAVGGGGGYALGEMFDGEAQADENGVPLDGLNLIPWLMAGGGAALFGGRQFLRNADNTVSMSGARGSRFAENVNPRNSEQSAPASGTNRARGRATGNAREEQIRRNARIMELVEEMQPTGNLPSGAANPGARLGIRLDNGHYAIAERMRAEGYPDVTRNIVTGVINRERARARRLAERAASEAEAPASAIPDSDEAAAARLGIPVDRYRQISARNPLAIGALALGTGALALTDDASASDGAPGDGWDWELPAAVGGLAALGGAAYLATRGRGNRMRVTEGMDGFSGTPKAAEDLGDGWIITHRPEMGRWAVVSPRNENGGRSTGTFTSREEALEGFRDMRAAETRMNEEVSRLQNARRDQYDNVFLGPPGSSGLPWDRAEIRIDEYAPLGPREHIVDTIDPTWSAQEIRESFNDLTPEQLQNWRVHQRPDGVWEVIADETAIRRSGSDADIAAIDSDLGRYVMGERRAYLGDMIENQRAFDREQLADNRTPLSMEGIVNLGTQGDGDRLRRRLDQSLEGYSLDPRRGDGHMIDNAPLLSIGAGTAGLGALALGAGEAGAEEGDDPDRPEQWDPMQIPFTPEQRRRYEAIMAEMDAQNERARAAAEEPVFAAPAPEPDSSEEDGLGWDDLGRIALPSILGVVGSRFNRGRNPLIGGSAGGALGGGIGAATSPEDDALSSITGGALLGLGSAVALPLIGRAGDELTPRRPNPNRPNFPPPPERIPDARERFGSLEDEMLEQELRAGRGTRETPEQGERRTRPSPIPAEERLDRPDDAIGSLRNRLMGSQFNIDRLRVMAREVGLDESGTKAELAQRLVDAARRDLAGGAPNPTPPPGTQWPPDPNANPSMVERWRRLYRQLGIPIAMTGAAVTADNDAR